MGSIMTPHVDSVTRLLMPSISLYVPYLNPGTMGEKGVWYLGFGVALRLPMVLPWKELWKETNSCLLPSGWRDFPVLRANLMAASLASEPLLQMKLLLALAKPPVACVSWMSCFERRPV